MQCLDFDSFKWKSYHDDFNTGNYGTRAHQPTKSLEEYTLQLIVVLISEYSSFRAAITETKESKSFFSILSSFFMLRTLTHHHDKVVSILTTCAYFWL